MWTVPRMWDGGDVFILGGGSSLTKQFDIPEKVVRAVKRKEESLSIYSPYLEALHNKHVIAINVLFLLGDWLDMMFFGDNKFYLSYKKRIADFPGLKVTCHSNFTSGFKKEKIKYLPKDNNHFQGISNNPSKVSWNKNSGAAAISVAANAGAKRIILLGFDMCLDAEGNQHSHTEYLNDRFLDSTKKRKKLPFPRHLKGFGEIQRDAKRRGIEILNASEISEIKVFPKINIKEVL